MEIITTLVSVFAAMVLFICLAGGVAFSFWYANKLATARKQSGIDAAELALLRSMLSDESKSMKEAELKAKLARVVAPPKPPVVRPTQSTTPQI